MLDCKDNNIKIIDTRATYIYNGWQGNDGQIGGHIPGAINFCADWIDQYHNYQEMVSDLYRLGIYKDSKVILYGEESCIVQNKMCDLGYTDVTKFYGGIDRWIEENEEGLFLVKLPNYGRLVNPYWMYDVLQNKEVEMPVSQDYKIIEVGCDNRTEYNEKHIPGAFYVDTGDFEALPMWNKIPDERIFDILKSFGITDETSVILYSRNNMAAARVWLILYYIGVKDIRILNGGFNEWVKVGFDTEQGTNYKISFEIDDSRFHKKANIILNYQQMKSVLNENMTNIISVRSKDEFNGLISGNSELALKGKITGSLDGNDIYKYRNIDGTMYNFSVIEKEWLALGIHKESKSIFYCDTGWRASEVIFYAIISGWKQVFLYDGGWFEWSQLQ